MAISFDKDTLRSDLEDLILGVLAARRSLRSQEDSSVAYFKVVQDARSSFLILNQDVRQKLEHRLALAGEAEIVPVDSLYQLQNICTDALKVILSVRSAKTVETATDAFASARIILLIMCSRPNESELCSDELVSMVLEMLHQTIVVEQSMSDKTRDHELTHLESQTQRTIRTLTQF